jgi:DNA-binding GntR family transcriptional regulator
MGAAAKLGVLLVNEPLYQRVVDDVTARIKAGELKPGQRLPTINDLAAEYEVGTTTIKTALMMLRASGVVVGQQGKAVYVAG